MAPVLTISQIHMATSVLVRTVSLAPNVSLTSDHASSIHVATMASRFFTIVSHILHVSPSSPLLAACQETSQSTYNCLCSSGWQGRHCETRINSCANVTCLNNGVCRPVLLNYTCACLGESYSGLHCEIKATSIAVRQKVSRSLAFVAILAIGCVMMFIVVLDLLKYCFGIHPADLETKRTKPLKYGNRPTFIVRFIYVNPPSVAADDQASVWEIRNCVCYWCYSVVLFIWM